MSKKLDIKIGQKFGKLIAIKEVKPATFSSGKRRRFLFKCDCGKKKKISLNHVINGDTTSCGCVNKEIITKHGYSQKDNLNYDLYTRWNSLIARCYNENSISYSNYGGRGITVCRAWKGSKGLDRFIEWSMANGYSKSLQLDRKNNNKGYSPSNCHYVTRKRNLQNKRNTFFVKHPKTGISIAFSELYYARPRTVKYNTARMRVSQYGWSVAEALR